MVPLLPFPCGFDNNTLIGIPGQKTDYCGNGATTDGFYNLYRAPLPASGAGSGCAQYAAAAPAARVVVRLRFLVAAGRQFDRMFQAFVGGSAVRARARRGRATALARLLAKCVRRRCGRCMARIACRMLNHVCTKPLHPGAQVMIGTTAEPGPAVDKKYNVSADVTDLQAALKPGSPVLFSLTQGMDNTYNVRATHGACVCWAAIASADMHLCSPEKPSNKRTRARRSPSGQRPSSTSIMPRAPPRPCARPTSASARRQRRPGKSCRCSSPAGRPGRPRRRTPI